MSVTVKTIAEITATATDITGTVYIPLSQDGTTKKADPQVFFASSYAVGVKDGTYNIGLSAALASSAMTVYLKQDDGSTDPSTGYQQCVINFRSGTESSGARQQITVTSTVSTVISNGSTLGSDSGYENNVYVYAILYSGSVELAVSGAPFPDDSIVSTTAEGGAGAADSKFVMYSTTARTNVPCRLLGRITSTQATAGSWATTPTKIEVLPSDKNEYGRNANGWFSASPDGVLRQWGLLAGATAITRTITFPKSFNAVTTYSIFTTGQASGANYFTLNPPAANKAVGSHQGRWASAPADTDNEISWIAYGRWKA